MNPELFLADLEAKPDVLASLAARLRGSDPWAGTGIEAGTRLIMLGMGSSHYANGVAAARLRSRGIDATAELASSDLLPRERPGTVIVAVTASGGSAETLHAMERYAGRAPLVAMTNGDGSAAEDLADHVVRMDAGAEAGGVACRSFQHTLGLWLDLESRLLAGRSAADTIDAAAVGSGHLLHRRAEWLPELIERAVGPDGTHIVAPAHRLSSAQQAALMLREGPRLPAVACETGDWSHVDVYLTKTTDYRLVLFAGSRWEAELLRWVRERGSTLVSVGGTVDGARQVIRYPGDETSDVALLTEVLVGELMSATLWT